MFWMNVDFCAHCRSSAEQKQLLRCGRCHMSRYCDQTCQRAHWPIHKTICSHRVTQHMQHPSAKQSLQCLNNLERTLCQLMEESRDPRSGLRNSSGLEKLERMLSYGVLPGHLALISYEGSSAQIANRQRMKELLLLLGDMECQDNPIGITAVPLRALRDIFPNLDDAAVQRLSEQEWRGIVQVKLDGGQSLIQTISFMNKSQVDAIRARNV